MLTLFFLLLNSRSNGDPEALPPPEDPALRGSSTKSAGELGSLLPLAALRRLDEDIFRVSPFPKVPPSPSADPSDPPLARDVPDPTRCIPFSCDEDFFTDPLVVMIQGHSRSSLRRKMIRTCITWQSKAERVPSGAE